jgi:hypothetical protein
MTSFLWAASGHLNAYTFKITTDFLLIPELGQTVFNIGNGNNKVAAPKRNHNPAAAAKLWVQSQYHCHYSHSFAVR